MGMFSSFVSFSTSKFRVVVDLLMSSSIWNCVLLV